MEKKSEQRISEISAHDRRPVRGLCQGEKEAYEITLATQQRLFDANLAAKSAGAETHNTLIICEHLPVYTLGKSGDENNMLFKPESVGASFHKIGRGGDITFHGPGQMVVYPIFDLEGLDIGLAGFVHALEEAVIKTVSHYGIKASRLSGAAGIWLDTETNPRKICAVGLKASRYCTMHGIALNVNTELRYFDYIVPCGIADKGVTSLQKELSREVSMKEVQNIFVKELESVLPVDITIA